MRTALSGWAALRPAATASVPSVSRRYTDSVLTLSLNSRRWTVAMSPITRRLSTSGTPTEAIPLTSTSTAFRLPSVVVASSVRDVPGFAFISRARSAPSTTSGTGASAAGASPSRKLICGPRSRNSGSGSTPLPTNTADLSPFEINPEKATRGSTAFTPGSRESPARSSAAPARPCCSGTSSSPS